MSSDVIAVLMLGYVVNFTLPVAEAATISTIDPYYSSSSAKCSGDWDSNLLFDFVHLTASDPSATDSLNATSRSGIWTSIVVIPARKLYLSR
jgi:hypothetical protein